MKAPISHSKDPDLRKVPEALLRAAENARRPSEQTGTPFITRSVAPAEISGDKPELPPTYTIQH